MSSLTPSKLGTLIDSPSSALQKAKSTVASTEIVKGAEYATSAVKNVAASLASPVAPPGPPPPGPVIPTSWLQPYEQRWLLVSLFGLVETIKVWDILAPYVIDPEPTWSSAVRISGPWLAFGWGLSELSSAWLVSLLRIPMLSPSSSQLGKIALLVVGWNLACWFVAEPGPFFTSINLIGPAALGGEWYWSWYYAVQRWREPQHLEGRYQIRLLPYSTATLNPLSLTYCIPPDSSQPVYIPIVFNNSQPNEVSYFVRSLDTGHGDLQTLSASSLKRLPTSKPRLQITQGEGEDEEDVAEEPQSDPFSAMILWSQSSAQERPHAVSKFPSVRPADSLQVAPRDLTPSESILFIAVDKPSTITLRSVADRQGDRFRITQRREAVVIECPIGGHFLEDDGKGKRSKKADKARPAELRCVGDEEVAHFEARGVGVLKVGWRKHGGHQSVTGVVEGIEADDEAQADVSVDPLALVRRDMVSKTHTVPLRIQHDQIGMYTIGLTSVTDSLHNTYTPQGHSAEKVYHVIGRPSASLDCRAPKELLEGGKVSVDLLLDGEASREAPVSATWSFGSADGKIQRGDTVQLSKRKTNIELVQPGVLRLEELSGACTGSILEPSTCSIVLVPKPTVDLQVETLHERSMVFGLSAAFEFTGAAPFRVEWTEQRNGGRPVKQSRKFNGHHGEITLQPEDEGQYTYVFQSVSDAKYSGVPISHPPIQQTVHPLANADIVGRGSDGVKRLKLYSCSGNEVSFEVDARGAAPMKLKYLKAWGGKSEEVAQTLSAGRNAVTVPLPPSASDAGSVAQGKFSIVLISVEDESGYIRKLAGASVEVEIDRRKPTARFNKEERVLVTEGQHVNAAVRLTGAPPWELIYAADTGTQQRALVRDANANLVLSESGTHRIISVKDAHCPGSVLDSASTFEVAYKPRPSVHVQPASTLTQAGSAFQHQGFCAGGEDQIVLRFSGEGPFELSYRYTADGKTSRHVLKSAKEIGVLHLATDPGAHRYDLLELKDANYANSPVSLSVQHEVASRPAASFVRFNTKPLCLDSALKGDARIRLEGKAPFTLNLAVRKPASTRVSEYSISVDSHEWALDLPHILSDIGKHEISLVSVVDSSGCDQEIRATDVLVTSVEVVESARIVPIDDRADLCVGDELDFLLQGKAPWVIEYEWLRKQHKVTSSAARFSRYAEKPGEFLVKSVALKDNQCKREISDLVRRVHALPSVKIQTGLDRLRQGDDPAAFSVTFTGTPPFSFTYTRSELQNNKPRVMETQTITDIQERHYTISSSAEGDYEVISVGDRYCRYPPLNRKEG